MPLGSGAVPVGQKQLTPIWHPSPNFGPRRGCGRPDMVVLHYTAMRSATAARDWLCAPEAQVSAHYVISESGTVWHLVQEEMRAWHAGAGAWGGIEDVNSHSIGIELCNTGVEPFSEPLMDALETLLSGILTRWAILPERVIGHSDMAPGRKIDPGQRFDWRRLALGGLAVWPDTAAGTSSDLRKWKGYTERFGYRWDTSGLLAGPHRPEDVVLAAFRSRFRPAAIGGLEAEDLRIAERLAKAFPVDPRASKA